MVEFALIEDRDRIVDQRHIMPYMDRSGRILLGFRPLRQKHQNLTGVEGGAIMFDPAKQDVSFFQIVRGNFFRHSATPLMNYALELAVRDGSSPNSFRYSFEK